MALTLTVTSFRGATPATDISGWFDRSGGTIGRSPDNRLVLPDPEKYISRHHGSIRWENGHFVYVDTSTAGTYIADGRTLLLNRSIELADGDRIRIGEYELQVRVFADGARPIDGLLDNHSAPAQDRYSLPTVEEVEVMQVPNTHPHSIRRDATAKPDPAPRASDAEADVFEIPDDLLGEETDWRRETLSLATQILGISSSGTPVAPPLPDFDEPTDRLRFAPKPRAAPDGVRESRAAPPPPPPATILRAPAGGDALRLLLDGFGALPAGRKESQFRAAPMREIGLLLAALADGITRASVDRSTFEDRCRRLTGQAASSAPTFDGRDAIKRFLLDGHGPIESVLSHLKKEVDALQMHQAALSTAYRSAAQTLFEQFSPDIYEKAAADAVVFQRKAKCWETYCRSYQEWIGKDNGDFPTQLLAQAYLRELTRLRGSSGER